MSETNSTKRHYFTAAWKQFLIARSTILAQYDAALQHAKQQAVQTHHGVVGEAAVRDWLAEFLPKRFGVTSGYIRSQGPPSLISSHFDVIVYDALEAPILWTETNADKAPGGRSRIIPAEYVTAILEVKASFNRRSVAAAIEKLKELEPFMSGVDDDGERFPKFLPATAALGLFFLELREADEQDRVPLEMLRVTLQRGFLGAIVLRGAADLPDATGVAYSATADIEARESDVSIWLEHGLRSHIAVIPVKDDIGAISAAVIQWSDSKFAEFAFELLAIMRGSYDGRRGFHPFDFSDPK